MVACVSPFNVEVKAPVVPVAVTLVFAVVGLVAVPYTIPLSVTAPPPSAVTLPPELADEDVILEAAVVETVANTAFMVKETLLP